MKNIIVTIGLITCAGMNALPFAEIKKSGQALKELITNVQIERFKRDSKIFFSFDSLTRPAEQEIYRQVAQELVDHARMTHKKKEDEIKLLVGKIIHDKPALVKGTILGILAPLFAYATMLCVVKQDLGRSIVAFAICAPCTWGANCYAQHAFNKTRFLQDQLKTLDEIIELCIEIQKKINVPETNERSLS